MTGQCTYDPPFATAITPSYIFSYLTPGGGGGANGTINFNGVGTQVTLQQTNGVSSHSNLPVTLSGTLDLRSFGSGNPCIWCNQPFIGTGVSSSEVPEPATWMSFGLAGVCLAALRKKIAG